ncbi:hypothetical protein M3G43_14545 [Brevibacterium casei]|uniref:hypothetical protein n=1 Tax=Brevibacterium casei TaxID=33889 RepID=UPI00223B71F9|nr:hypothetical protein [Brevibacterium casei]MCT1448475.1 hypothetical protein [Brevibacterium casei]
MNLIPPSLLTSMPQAVSFALVAVVAVGYVIREWRKGLAERASEAEKELKTLKANSSAEIADLEEQIREMKEDFDRQLSEIQAKLNGRIATLETVDVANRSIIYRLRQRMAENGLSHDDIT